MVYINQGRLLLSQFFGGCLLDFGAPFLFVPDTPKPCSFAVSFARFKHARPLANVRGYGKPCYPIPKSTKMSKTFSDELTLELRLVWQKCLACLMKKSADYSESSGHIVESGICNIALILMVGKPT